jgi:hypothetical protein
MTAAKAHNWTFRSRFRANAFGWRSDLPIKRIKEAVAEIKKATRKDKILGAERAVLFLEKVSGALRATWFRPKRRRSQTASSMIRKGSMFCANAESRDVLEALAALMRPLTTDAARVRRLVNDADAAGFQFDD